LNKAKIFSAMAALQGHRLPISTRPAPFTPPSDAMVIEPGTSPQVPRIPRQRVRLHRNVGYAVRRTGKGTRQLRMDIHVPRGAGPYPLVIFLPGGGFVVCVRRSAARQRAYLADHGYVVASIDYSTVTSGARYSDAIGDVRAAVRYLRAHAAQFQIDPARVALWGQSAGGYLATMTALTDDDQQFDVGDHLDQASTVSAVIDMFGPADLPEMAAGFDERTIAAYDEVANANARYVLGPGSRVSLRDAPDAAAQASPLAAAARRPDIRQSFLLFHGTEDRIVSPHQSAALHAALRAAGAESTFCVVADAEHGDVSVNGSTSRIWTTTTFMATILTFLDRTLAPPAVAADETSHGNR
jgi:acetyl esterase/lipase